MSPAPLLPSRGEGPDLVSRLGEHGYVISDALVSSDAAHATARLATTLCFTPAGIRRGHEQDPLVRSDETTWLDDSPLHATFTALRDQLNRIAYLGLERFDVQLARYAPGAAYARHRDAFAGPGNRRVTAIVYLNEGWLPAHGGQLRLHVDPWVDVAPVLGRAVIFLSDRIEHEVLTAHAPRFAITAWYYGP